MTRGYIFSLFVSSHPRGIPHFHPIILPLVPRSFCEGYPIPIPLYFYWSHVLSRGSPMTLSRSLPGGTPVPGWRVGYPCPRQGVLQSQAGVYPSPRTGCGTLHIQLVSTTSSVFKVFLLLGGFSEQLSQRSSKVSKVPNFQSSPFTTGMGWGGEFSEYMLI